MKEIHHVYSKRIDRGKLLNKDDDVVRVISGGDSSAFSTNLYKSNHRIKAISSDETLEQGINNNNVTVGKSTNSDTKSLHKSMQMVYDREENVASDHGAHELIISLDERANCNTHLVKKMTCSLKEVYEVSTASKRLKLSSNRTSKKCGSQVSCKKSVGSQASVKKKEADILNKSHDIKEKPEKDAPSSLLHAALLHQSSLNADIHGMSPPSLRGKCLTIPGAADSNSGLDNKEGNLIVHENDLIRVIPSNIHMHKSKVDIPNYTNLDKFKMTGYQVLGLLGQGTFAQVFKCRCLATGNLVALKIVKNKDAYTRQAAVEIDIFQALAKGIPRRDSLDNLMHETEENHADKESNLMVEMLCYFMHQSHLCLVFELLGKNLYEVLKRRQFRGLPIGIVRELLAQAIEGVNELSQRNIVHCDVKPENILVVSDNAVQDMVHAGETGNVISKSSNTKRNEPKSSLPGGLRRGKEIKLIDFGSACFEGETAHTYIQSRFYRSPEVLVGLDYDSAIDMWSLGCVAAELFLGLPILPGVHEHDQIIRICEMIGQIPDWMLDQGLKSEKYFVRREGKSGHKGGNPSFIPLSRTLAKSQDYSCETSQDYWQLKTREEFVSSLSAEEKDQCGGLSKYEQQPTNRYFKRKSLEDIVMRHGSCSSSEEKDQLGLFVHLLKGILNPDPCERWTAFQASTHPFITGNTSRIRRKRSDESVSTRKTETNNVAAPVAWDIHWKAPFDCTICRRKLALKEIRKGVSGYLERSLPTCNAFSSDTNHARLCQHHTSLNTSSVTDLTGAMSLSHSYVHPNHDSPPPVASAISGSLRPPFQAESLPYALQNPISSGLQFQHAMHVPSHHQLASSLSHIHSRFDSSEIQSSSILSTPANTTDINTENSNHIVPIFPTTLGAQSYSGVHYDRINHAPAEGELGYALQRPGVVPNGHMAHINPILLQQHPPAINEPQQPPGLSYIAPPAMAHYSPNVNANGLSVGGIHGLIHLAPGQEVGCIHGTMPITPGHDFRMIIPQDTSSQHMQQYSSLHQHEVPYNINEYGIPPNGVYYTGPSM